MARLKHTLRQRLRRHWTGNCQIARRVAFAAGERPRRKQYSVSPLFDLFVLGLFVVLGVGLLL